MSFDLNLNTLCDHAVFREMAFVQDDRRTIRLGEPLGAINSVQLYASDNMVPTNMYEVVSAPNEVDLNRDKIIWFKEKWKDLSDFFEINYVTQPSFCVKCAGNNYLDDISYNVRKELLETQNEYLLMQNVEKFIVTILNSNPFHLFIGTGLVGLIGKRISNFNFLSTQITSEINRALQKLQDLQGQYQMAGRTVTQGELLASIDDIQVVQDTNDPSVVRVNVTVSAQSGKTVEFTQIIRI
jgi:hypothetical protein